MPRLRRGDRPPRMICEPPGPRARELCRRLAAVEAPGINTVAGGEATILWQEARGANVLDVDGNRYVDLTSGFGVAAVGHRHPAVVAAVRRQSASLLHALGDVHAHPLRLELAERLAALAPVAGDAGDPPAIYFGISGADAVEIALKTALLATGRAAVLAFDPAYHGLTLGALALTSRPAFRRPFAPWLNPRVERLPFGAPASDVERLLADHPDVGCCVVEPIAGREGVLLPPPGWLTALGDACRRRSVLLVADEIFTGCGRTGRWFAVEHEGVRPDLLVCGKALGGGLPIAAVAGRRSLMAAWEHPGEARHTATFVANPPACAAALAVLDALAGEELVARAGRLGGLVGERLAAWPERFATVAAVRGRGLLWAVELTGAAAAGRLVSAARRRGVLLLAGGPQGRVAQILPPLSVGERQLGVALGLLEEALGAAAAGSQQP